MVQRCLVMLLHHSAIITRCTFSWRDIRSSIEQVSLVVFLGFTSYLHCLRALLLTLLSDESRSTQPSSPTNQSPDHYVTVWNKIPSTTLSITCLDLLLLSHSTISCRQAGWPF